MLLIHPGLSGNPLKGFPGSFMQFLGYAVNEKESSIKP
jgi:hypothetical protein